MVWTQMGGPTKWRGWTGLRSFQPNDARVCKRMENNRNHNFSPHDDSVTGIIADRQTTTFIDPQPAVGQQQFLDFAGLASLR